ncbi:MAG: hypothetical protein ORO03_10680, partial [Alphaproteobacteria bacterium]|nr:hypothetical protein [Alphaproteobacteria bacterium]
ITASKIDGGSGGVMIVAPNKEVTISGALAVLGTYLRLDMGSTGHLVSPSGASYTLTANGLDVLYTSATTGNSGTIAVGKGSFTFVNDKRSVTTAVTLNNSSTATTATIGWGTGLGTLASGTAVGGLTVTTTGAASTINNQGVVYGGTVDIQGISTGVAKDLRWIEGTGVGVTAASGLTATTGASTFSGDLTLVGNGSGIVSGSYTVGVAITANLTTGNGGNLTLLQNGAASGYGILINSSILTAGGGLSLTQSGSVFFHGIHAQSATLSAGGAMSLTQSGNALQIGIYASTSNMSTDGAMTLTSSGSTVYNGIRSEMNTLTAGSDLTVLQTGTVGSGYDGIALYSSSTTGGANIFSAGSSSVVNFKTNNQNLSLNRDNNFRVSGGKLRIDLGTGVMISKNSLGAALAAGSGHFLIATGLEVYYTGATTGNSATIAVGSGSFTFVGNGGS